MPLPPISHSFTHHTTHCHKKDKTQNDRPWAHFRKPNQSPCTCATFLETLRPHGCVLGASVKERRGPVSRADGDNVHWDHGAACPMYNQ